jgi:hypothetical protein
VLAAEHPLELELLQLAADGIDVAGDAGGRRLVVLRGGKLEQLGRIREALFDVLEPADQAVEL